jgi:transposase
MQKLVTTIQSLRAQGLSYREIDAELGLDELEMRSYVVMRLWRARRNRK